MAGEPADPLTGDPPRRSLGGGGMDALCHTLCRLGNVLVPSCIGRDGVLMFDGKTHIVTPAERFAPVTLEAWVWPEEYLDHGRQCILGSDIATTWGNSSGISGANLAAESISGDIFSEQQMPMLTWSLAAAVFGVDETRHFVIGCVGETNPIDHFRGKVRSVRISRGETYPGRGLHAR